MRREFSFCVKYTFDDDGVFEECEHLSNRPSM